MLLHSSKQLVRSTLPVPAPTVALHSKFFLQNARTQQFFQGIDRWTNNADRALIFYDVQEAAYISRWLGLNDVRIVSDLDNVDTMRALPCVA